MSVCIHTFMHVRVALLQKATIALDLFDVGSLFAFLCCATLRLGKANSAAV